MHNSKPEKTKKKAYFPPEIQAFQTLKEITLANTCGCDYWGDYMKQCAYCSVQSDEVDCPNIATMKCK